MTRLLFALALLAPAATRAAQLIEKDDSYRNPVWKCAVAGYQAQMSAPVLEPRPEVQQDSNRQAARRVEQVRKKLLLTHQALDRMQKAVMDLVSATNNECDAIWSSWDVLRSTVEAAVRDEERPLLDMYERSGWRVRWETAAVSRLAAELKDVEAQPGHFAQVCRQVRPDARFYAPDLKGLPEQTAAKLAQVEAMARRAAADITAQSEALDAALPLTQGRRCGDIVRAFERLVSAERQAFFAFRQKAVADAFWDSLDWRELPAPAAP